MKLNVYAKKLSIDKILYPSLPFLVTSNQFNIIITFVEKYTLSNSFWTIIYLLNKLLYTHIFMNE